MHPPKLMCQEKNFAKETSVVISMHGWALNPDYIECTYMPFELTSKER